MKLVLQGSLTRDLPLPGLGSVRSFSGRRQDTEIFFSYTDFVTPGANYRCSHELWCLQLGSPAGCARPTACAAEFRGPTACDGSTIG